MTQLPVTRAHLLQEKIKSERWLVDGLWGDQAVGVVGGEPKCCKSFTALTLAVSVASGRPCFGEFAVQNPGRVLLFAAEDAPHIVRSRLEGICAAQSLSLATLPIFVITAPALRLDSGADVLRLQETVKELQPKLLVLDPFVRLHAIDENASGEVAKILDKLRGIQRTFGTAVALVHHARKGGSALRPGQALRGSSEFHAWGDSNLYLRRDRSGQLSLIAEHRAAATLDPLVLKLVTDTEYPYLVCVREGNRVADNTGQSDPADLLLQLLANAPQPLRLAEIRTQLKLRNSTVSELLNRLLERNSIQHTPDGYTV